MNVQNANQQATDGLMKIRTSDVHVGAQQIAVQGVVKTRPVKKTVIDSDVMEKEPGWFKDNNRY